MHVIVSGVSPVQNAGNVRSVSKGVMQNGRAQIVLRRKWKYKMS